MSDDEKRRAERFRFDRDRNKFIVVRATLRKILSRYLSALPQEIVFCYSEAGKPALTGCDQADLHFNLSHSRNWAVFVVARGRRVGIDVEETRIINDLQAIAGRSFTAREANSLRSLSPDECQDTFFRDWTRKEAFVKAVGEGLALSLRQIEVLPRAEDMEIVHTYNGVLWSICDVPIAPNCFCALAIEGIHPQIVLIDSSEQRLSELASC